MKKILTIAIAVMMIAVMSVSVFAADSGTIYVKDLVSGTDYADLGNMGLQGVGGDKGEEAQANGGCLGLGAEKKDGVPVSTAHITFTVNAEKAGTYNLVVRYAAKKSEGKNRCFDISVNGGEKKTFENLGGADWATYYDATVENVHLNAGTNSVKLTNVEGFDDNTYKAINVLSLTYTLVTADPVEEETTTAAPDETTTAAPDDTTVAPDDTTTAPDNTPDTKPDEEDKAPQTGIVTAILVAAAAFSSAYIVSKKH